MKLKTCIVAVFAIGCITGIELMALAHGLNGTALGGSLAAIGAVLGWVLKMVSDKAKNGKSNRHTL